MSDVTVFIREHTAAIVIGFAAVTLIVATVLVMAAMGVLGDPVTAEGSPTPQATPSTGPSVSASPQPSSSAAPTDAPWAGYELTDISTPLFSSVWARIAVDRLNVRSAPGTDAPVAGLLRRGDLVRVGGDGEGADTLWFPVVGDGLAGWVAAGDGQDAFLQPVATPWLFGSQRMLEGVTASGQGVLAYGWASDFAVRPYEGTGLSGMLYSSTDGDTFDETAGGGAVTDAAGGRDGFIIVRVQSHLGPTTVELSPDGLDWSQPMPIDLTPGAAAWGPGGAIVVGNATDGGPQVAAVRVSSAGVVQPVAFPTLDVVDVGIESSGAGYVIFDKTVTDTVLVSRDGITWRSVEVPNEVTKAQIVRDVEMMGDRVTFVMSDAVSGDTELSSGRLAGDNTIAWDAATSSPFGQATVDSISASDGVLLAFGWDREGLVPRIWRSRGGADWNELDVAPDALGGAIGPEPAFADGQWVAVTDAIYTSANGETWQLAHRPSTTEIAHPGCPPADTVTALDLMFLGSTAADCYGDAPLTFRAWTPIVDGLGGCCAPESRPGWLTSWIPPAFVSPGQGEFNNSFGVFPARDMTGAFEDETWADVTGHFRDPASRQCAHIPLTNIAFQRLESRAAVIDGCKRRFVVDRVDTLR